MLLKSFVRDVPDFPKKGIVFKDLTPLLCDGAAFREAVAGLAAGAKGAVDKVVAVEARGFLFGAAVAAELGVGVVPVRKKGKLPFFCHSVSYDLEYGKDVLEMHLDALSPAERVLIVDDVLATGGTCGAVIQLVRKTGATVTEAAFVIELEFLKGREKLGGVPARALIKY
jgi:adenine phosphoribosyltransferase